MTPPKAVAARMMGMVRIMESIMENTTFVIGYGTLPRNIINHTQRPGTVYVPGHFISCSHVAYLLLSPE